MKLTYIQQSGSPPVGDGGDQYTGLDRFGRVVDQRWIKESSGADLERVEYGFDRASNRVWRDNTVADALSAKQDEFYTYDGLNQLLTLQRGTLNSGKTGISGTPTWEEDFTIDPTGNWENYVNQVNGTTTLNQPRTHNAVNEVETISGSGSLMTQNAAGNMSKAPQPLDWGRAYAMTYDAWQRLVKVKSGSTTVAAYAYDGQNRRTTKVTGSTTRHYYYSSQWQILEERLNATTTADRQFVWGLMALDNLILRDRGSERFYSLQDVFSCTAIVDTSGTVQERYGYNAFGLSRVMDADFNVISLSSYDWETRYACYRFDSESSFYQVRNRYLHPTLGRWLTREPLDLGINLYAYVGNNPMSQIDSLGLFAGPVIKFIATCIKDFILQGLIDNIKAWFGKELTCSDVRDYFDSGHQLDDWCKGVAFDTQLSFDPSGTSYGERLLACLWGQVAGTGAEKILHQAEGVEKKLLEKILEKGPDQVGSVIKDAIANSKYHVTAQCCKGVMQVSLSLNTTITIEGEPFELDDPIPFKNPSCSAISGANQICGNC